MPSMLPSAPIMPLVPRIPRIPDISVSYYAEPETEEIDDFEYDTFSEEESTRQQASQLGLSQFESDKTVWERCYYDPSRGEGEKGLVYRERAINTKGPRSHNDTEVKELEGTIKKANSEIDSIDIGCGRLENLPSSSSGSSLYFEPELDRKMRLLKMSGDNGEYQLESEQSSDITWTATSLGQRSTRSISYDRTRSSRTCPSSIRSSRTRSSYNRSRNEDDSSDSDYY